MVVLAVMSDYNVFVAVVVYAVDDVVVVIDLD
jgi:hypothetical protein